MRVRLHKWGNSLAIRIPKPFAQDAGMREGAEVELAVRRGRLVAAPVAAGRYRLRDLLAAITPENVHSEVDVGPRVGREIW